MLDHFFLRRDSLERIGKAPFQEYLGFLAEDLHVKGYSLFSGQEYLRAAAGFLSWLAEQEIPLPGVEMEHVKTFLGDPMGCARDGGWTIPVRWTTYRTGARHMLRIIRELRPAVPPAQPRTPAEASLAEFREHLRGRCGFADITVKVHTTHVRAFLVHFVGDGPMCVNDLTPAQVAAYVTDCARISLPKSRFVTSALRSYFRFLQLHENPTSQLIMAIPRIAHPPVRLSARETLTEAQSHDLLSSFDLSRPKEQRDYAMALCMLALGMRSSDVAQLVLEDINWRDGIICIPGVKTRRPYQLPLPVSVGEAISSYLRNGRPKTTLRQVFLRHHRPVKNMEPRSVQSAMANAYVRAGLPGNRYGCHILRRTAATGMHRAGVPLKEIADVLGHQSINTTLLYTRLDPPELAKVALPWPGGRP